MPKNKKNVGKIENVKKRFSERMKNVQNVYLHLWSLSVTFQ